MPTIITHVKIENLSNIAVTASKNGVFFKSPISRMRLEADGTGGADETLQNGGPMGPPIGSPLSQKCVIIVVNLNLLASCAW